MPQRRDSAATSSRPTANMRVSRQATLNTIATDITAPARATTSQRSGWALPNRPNTVVNSIGSGFHEGPPGVCRSRWTISRPQTNQAQGS
jgi:hypothetical protein